MPNPPITQAECEPVWEALRASRGNLTGAGRRLGQKRGWVTRRVRRGEAMGWVPDDVAALLADEEVGVTDWSAPVEPSISTTKNPDGTISLSADCDTGHIDDLLKRIGVERSEVEVTDWRVGSWQQKPKDEEALWLYSTRAVLRQKPEWARWEVQPVNHLPRMESTSVSGEFATCLVVPDSQVGYRWDSKRRHLEPIHDRQAFDVAVQLAQVEQPGVIVLLGDMLDLAPWSMKFATTADLHYTTQPALHELHWWIGQLRLAAPHARIVYLEGNHESRIDRAIVERLGEAQALRPVGDADGHAILSVPRLLALDSLGVEYVGPYGEAEWIWGIKFHHGRKVGSSGGKSVAKVLDRATHSEVFGHVHRAELASRTLHGPDGQSIIFALTPGTIARIDGVVPAHTPEVDWQQAIGIIRRCAVTGEVFPHLAHVSNGRTVWGGRTVLGESRAEELSDATGWRF